MTMVVWRRLAIVLAVLCAYQRWQSCTRVMPKAQQTAGAGAADGAATAGATASADVEPPGDRVARGHSSAPAPALDDAAKPTRGFYGFKAPAWAMQLAPHHGETMREYRDRVLPLAELAIAPQRARVARMRDALALDTRQREQLDGAVTDASAAIEKRVTAAIVSGELRPADFKPMTGVALARDVLDIVDHGNTRFLDSLSPEKRAQLVANHFDFADYLLFSAKWEDALHVLD
jgi:hypothetical protein